VSKGRGIELEVAYFERLVAGPTLALLRLGGRWAGVDEADLDPAVLVLEAAGREHRLRALPEVPDAPLEPEAPWRAAFAAPREVASSRSTAFTLHVGPTVPLPAPYERRLGGVSAAGA
jgi:hypothetical protein